VRKTASFVGHHGRSAVRKSKSLVGRVQTRWQLGIANRVKVHGLNASGQHIETDRPAVVTSVDGAPVNVPVWTLIRLSPYGTVSWPIEDFAIEINGITIGRGHRARTTGVAVLQQSGEHASSNGLRRIGFGKIGVSGSVFGLNHAAFGRCIKRAI
jgi:hypothetical protein